MTYTPEQERAFEERLREERGDDLECYSIYHNEPEGCRGPGCWKNPNVAPGSDGFDARYAPVLARMGPSPKIERRDRG